MPKGGIIFGRNRKDPGGSFFGGVYIGALYLENFMRENAGLCTPLELSPMHQLVLVSIGV